jgi:hypothetical protein
MNQRLGHDSKVAAGRSVTRRHFDRGSWSQPETPGTWPLSVESLQSVGDVASVRRKHLPRVRVDDERGSNAKAPRRIPRRGAAGALKTDDPPRSNCGRIACAPIISFARRSCLRRANPVVELSSLQAARSTPKDRSYRHLPAVRNRLPVPLCPPMSGVSPVLVVRSFSKL